MEANTPRTRQSTSPGLRALALHRDRLPPELDRRPRVTSYELFLEDALTFVLGRTPTPTLDAMGRDYAGFNTAQVAARRGRTPQQVMDEYTQARTRVMALVEELGLERLRAVGTIPWYGADYALDDFIVYAIYGHEREHCGQVRQFKLRIAAGG